MFSLHFGSPCVIRRATCDDRKRSGTQSYFFSRILPTRAFLMRYTVIPSREQNFSPGLTTETGSIFAAKPAAVMTHREIVRHTRRLESVLCPSGSNFFPKRWRNVAKTAAREVRPARGGRECICVKGKKKNEDRSLCAGHVGTSSTLGGTM